LRKHFDSQSAPRQALGRACFGRALAMAEKKRIALKITERAIANSEPEVVTVDVLLEAAGTFVARGSRSRAIELVAQLMPLTDGRGDTQIGLLFVLAVIVAAVGYEE